MGARARGRCVCTRGSAHAPVCFSRVVSCPARDPSAQRRFASPHGRRQEQSSRRRQWRRDGHVRSKPIPHRIGCAARQHGHQRWRARGPQTFPLGGASIQRSHIAHARHDRGHPGGPLSHSLYLSHLPRVCRWRRCAPFILRRARPPPPHPRWAARCPTSIWRAARVQRGQGEMEPEGAGPGGNRTFGVSQSERGRGLRPP